MYTEYNPIIKQSDAQKENKKVFRILSIEFLLVVFILGAVFFLLNFYNIIPLSQISPALFGFLPHKSSQTDVTGKALNPNEPIIKSGDLGTPEAILVEENKVSVDNLPIGTASDYPSHELVLKDQKGLKRLMNEWNTGGVLKKLNSNKNIRKISIVLSDKPVRANLISNPKTGVFSSAAEEILDNNASLNVYFSAKVLSDPTFNISSGFNYQLLRLLYNLTHKPVNTTDTTEYNKEMESVVGKELNSNTYFEVKKK